MQTPAPTPQAPARPAGTPVEIDVGTSQLIPIPQTREDVAALRIRREELSDQLQSAASRRERVARELQSATGADRAGLEGRLAVLDRRIGTLENDIAVTGRLLTQAPSFALTSPPRPQPRSPIQGMDSDAFAALTGVFIIFVLGPMSFGLSRFFWKRARAPQPVRSQEEMQRLERIEQAVDAIAIEVERISEAQRFTTRLLSESPSIPALGAGQAAAEPLRAREREPIPARREPY